MNHRLNPLVSTCHVERGLYLLRYVDAATHPFPRADIEVTTGDIIVLQAPGRKSLALLAPGEALIIRAEQPSDFEIRVSGVRGESADAKFSIDLLDAGAVTHAGPVSAEAAWQTPTSQPDAMPSLPYTDRIGPSVLAHVSRRGDVAVGTNAWVAGPDEVLPIEGLAISTGRDDLGVRLRIRSAQGGSEWSRWHEPGEFAGSRQRADPLTSLALELIGPAADRFEIRAEVMALGSPPLTSTGQSVEFPGIDPLVGFRFGLNAATVSESLTTQRQAPSVRVFRAKR